MIDLSAHMPTVAPSILSADFGRLAEETRALTDLGLSVLHLDVMDGHFVPNLTFGPAAVAAVRRATDAVLDTHLMVSNPEAMVPWFAEAGADLITVHAEASPHIHRLIQTIHDRGKAAGVALNPATPLAAVEEVLADLDLLLIMTVNPGFGGQRFIESMSDKIARARDMLDRAGSKAVLQVDGGVGPGNAEQLAALGATCLVAGSALVGRKDRKAAMEAIFQAAGGPWAALA